MSMQTREQMLLDLAVKAHRDLIAQARAEGERVGRIAMREMAAKIADDLYDEPPRGYYDNGGTQDGWQQACVQIEKRIRALKVEGE